MALKFTKQTAKKWMQDNYKQCVDPKTGEINATALAEDCVRAFDCDFIGGPLEDESHWVWDLAIDFVE